jgi:hypothetical protein
VAIAEFHGGNIAREAKALTSSAAAWAHQVKAAPLQYEEALQRSVRSIDPFVHMRGKWIVRRLAPDCSRVELSSMPKQRDESRLLQSMGFETANVHLGTRKAPSAILKDLRARPKLWLHRAASTMVDATIHDWETWRAKHK